MKQTILSLAACALILAGCSKDKADPSETFEPYEVVPYATKAVTFTCQGDWQQTKDLAANGTSMTDIWAFDYVNGLLIQIIHQDDNTAADFGSPSIDLSFGTHTIYFVASRGNTPTVNTTAHTITWAKVGDTFHKTISVTVDANTGSQAVTLERVVAKLKMTINDAIATGTTNFLVTPHLWYYGLDYTTGDPTSSATDQAITLNCPSDYVGQSGKFMTVYTFSSSAQWNANVTIAAMAGTTTISSVSIPNVPIQRNHSTDYSGNLFTNGGTSTLTLNDTWGDPINGTW